jgi:ABC-2 type transport system permease protein
LSPLQDTLVIWRAETGRALRSGRAAGLLALYGLFSALVLLAVGWAVRTAREQLARQTGDALTAAQLSEQMQQGFLGVLVGSDPAVLEALAQVPVVMVVLFKLTLLFLPLYVALMGFDQVSGELGPRSIRYLTVRTRRSSVLGGKFLAQATLLLGLVLAVDTATFAYALVTTPDFPASVAVVTLLRMWLATTVFSLAYIALTSLCSTLFGTPGVSLVGNVALLFLFWLLNLIGTGAALTAEARGEAFSPLGLLRLVSPSHYANGLLHPEPGPFFLSVLAYLGFTAAFLLLAHLVLKARDL